jgi:competence protein ComEA
VAAAFAHLCARCAVAAAAIGDRRRGAGLLAALLVRPRSGITISGPGATFTATTIQVYVLGAVATPGVYTLPPDARVHDAIAAAGGATREANLTSVSLAAQMRDGQSIYVPHTGETIPLLLGGKLNLNSTSAQDLRNALGIRLTIAKRIVAYRAAHGPFSAVNQLLLVPISRSEYDRMKDLVTV